ncbi:hypothetical protein RQP46_005648 [Phenoliferia psychrophenolica]
MQTISLKVALPVGKSVCVNLRVICSYEEKIALPATVGTFVFPNLDTEGSEAETEKSTMSLFSESRSATPVQTDRDAVGVDAVAATVTEPVHPLSSTATAAILDHLEETFAVLEVRDVGPTVAALVHILEGAHPTTRPLLREVERHYGGLYKAI